jgi:AcrR family transcriptional regulator
MKRRRLTREQSKIQTRERLLSAARASFLKKGYVAASVEEIATAAGYTRGAFYSNFRGKTELLLELLARDLDEVHAELKRIVEASDTWEEMGSVVLACYRKLCRRHASFLLWMEAKLHAARDLRFCAHLDPLLNKKLEQITVCIGAFAERTGAPLSLPAEILALGLMGLCDGLQSCYATNPRYMTDELTEAVLAGFLAHAMINRAPD